MYYQSNYHKLDCQQAKTEPTPCESTMKKKTKVLKNASSNQCKVCGLVNFNSWALTIHMRRHNNEKPAKCSYCSASFVNNSELKIHISTHTKEKKYKCRFCPKLFTNKSSKYVHEDTHGILEHKCKYCPAKFTSQADRRIHQKTHGRGAFACRFCMKNFANEGFRRHHEESYHPKALKCKKCELKFHSLEEFNAHKIKHKHSSSHRPSKPVNPRSNEVSYFQDSDVRLSSYFFTCGICSEKFSFHVDLSMHIETFHPSEEKDSIYKFKCSECNKSFDTKMKLKGHMIGHGPKKYKCSYCNYKSARGKDLTKHVAAKHSDGKNYRCSECGLVFNHYSTFVLHKSKHGEKKFQCDMCDKSYYVKSRLANHKRISHYSASPVCEQCGKMFKNIITLKAHQKRFHNRSPPICMCNYCGGSVYINDIITHKAICPCEKQVDSNNLLKGPCCSTCNVTFSIQKDLIDHCKDLHPALIYPCNYCKKVYLSNAMVQRHISRNHSANNSIHKKRKQILTLDEKRELRKSSSFLCPNFVYECFACGSPFQSKIDLCDHIDEGVCLETNFSRPDDNEESKRFTVTKIYEWKGQTRILNDYKVEVTPIKHRSEPLNVTAISNLTNVQEETLVNNSDDSVHINHNILNNSNSFEVNSIIDSALSSNGDSYYVPLDDNKDVVSEVDDKKVVTQGLKHFSTNSTLGEVMSSQALIKLLQRKTINVDGIPFIPYDELLEHLKCVSAIDVSAK